MPPPAVSAYVPCFNNQDTVALALESLQRQTVPPAEIFVVDDGSTDGCAEVAEAMGVPVLRQGENLGRGAARARAMAAAAHPLVLSCDAGVRLAPDFLERALPWFEDARVAAVYGRFSPAPAGAGAADRWRARHLFKLEGRSMEPKHGTLLLTGGTLARRDAVLGVGNFAAALRHSEDAHLGERLLAAGWDVVEDPALGMAAARANTVAEVLERHWRWHAGEAEAASLSGYARAVAHSVKVMARQDLRRGDVGAAAISLLCPHHGFWRTVSRRVRGVRQSAPPPARTGKRRWRIGVIHPYLEGREADCARGLYPASHLWGCDELAARADEFEVVILRASGKGRWENLLRSLSKVSKFRFGDWDQEWPALRQLGSFDALYIVSGNVFLTLLVCAARRALLPGRRTPRTVRWVYTRPKTFPWWQLRNFPNWPSFLRQHAGFLCLTRDAEAHYRRAALGARVRQLDWGVDLAMFPGSDAPGEFFFACGRTNRDYPTLVKAAALLPTQSFKLVVSAELLAGLDVPTNVHHAGGPADAWTDQGVPYPELIQNFYGRCIALLIPRKADPYDTCGLTNLLEGMAMGRPIVMTRTGALDLDIEREGIGLHVEPGDAGSWARALTWMVEHPEERRAMGRRARALCESHFHTRRFGEDLAKYFRNMLTGGAEKNLATDETPMKHRWEGAVETTGAQLPPPFSPSGLHLCSSVAKPGSEGRGGDLS